MDSGALALIRAAQLAVPVILTLPDEKHEQNPTVVVTILKNAARGVLSYVSITGSSFIGDSTTCKKIKYSIWLRSGSWFYNKRKMQVKITYNRIEFS